VSTLAVCCAHCRVPHALCPLWPTRNHLPIEKYWHPDQFKELRRIGEEELGFRWVESGPLVRSSYHADGQARLISRTDIPTPALA